MINVIYAKDKKSFFKTVKIFGHSNFSEYGKDIVCSSVSSIVFGSFSFFKNYYSKFVSCEKKDNEIFFRILDFSEKVDLCFLMMIHQLENISNFYPEIVSLKRTE